MIRKFTFLALMILPFLGCTQTKSQTDKNEVSPMVIELFTSEGCSSCPPADDLVAKIQKEYQDKPVYILSYHVDYWDRLGWKDTFSNAAFSKRQYKYATWLKNSSVYTPQIVVNGFSQFVGSNAAKLRSELAKKSILNEHIIKLTVNKQGEDKLAVDFSLTANDKNNKLNLALVEDNATTDVKRGENSNRTLHHVDIVRELKTINAAKNGSVVFNLPSNLSKNYHVVAFLQNSQTGKITAAAGN
ncbi:hypothetical protein ABIB40_003004 [Pedobacter sp. UYP30]|uniref:DUF1223 domain-containing protein n=1 Tax=Pedobacter sp. UYP30 TaxID=1756400 RepID=UPI003395D881